MADYNKIITKKYLKPDNVNFPEKIMTHNIMMIYQLKGNILEKPRDKSYLKKEKEKLAEYRTNFMSQSVQRINNNFSGNGCSRKKTAL